MKYLFFDIECANRDGTGRNMIYSFGYLISDENLNILEKETDIVINPNIEVWDWHVVRNILAYSKKHVEEQPTFPRFYKKIRKLLEDPENIVCGFSVKDDVGYLLDECERYDLDPFKINFLDIQRLEAEVSDCKTIGLSEAYIKWCNRLPSSAHRSDSDAFYTYEVAKAISKKTKNSLIIYTKVKKFTGGTDGLRYGFNDEKFETRDERRTRREVERNLLGENVSSSTRFRRIKDGDEDFMLKGSKNALLFLRMLDNVQPAMERPKVLLGKKVSISLNYELYHFQSMMKLVQIISDCGGEYVKKASLANIFVQYHLCIDGEERPCSKSAFVKNEIDKGSNIQIMEFDEFLSLLGISEAYLAELEAIDYNYLMDEKYKKKG